MTSMFLVSSQSLAIGIGVLVVVVFYRFLMSGRRAHGLPPGPPTVPFLGNAHQFPSRNAYLRFTDWAKEYGGIYSLIMASQPMIIISNARIARDLIDKKSGSASDRPPNYMIDLVTDGKYLTFARYSQDWKTARTMLQKMLTKEAVSRHQPIQRAEATQLTYDMLIDPEHFFEHTARYSYSLATCILAGTRSPRSTSPLLTAFSVMIHKWSGLLEPGSQPPVDLWPILTYIPERFARWKTLCREIRAQQFELYDGFINIARRRVAQGKQNGSLLESVVADNKLGRDDVLIRGTIGAFLEGATDTTSIFLRSLILMLVAHPDVLSRAQKEIDAIVGSGRAPAPDDIDDLPYIQAVIKETLRMRPPVPTGVPHYTTQDETIEGFFIPKGSIVFINQYGILHDPEVYDDPDTFNPDRFLQSEFGAKSGAELEGRRNDHHFGGGRRICLGMHLANNSMVSNALNFIWAFNLKPATNPATKQIIPVDINDYSEGIAPAPNPFKCEIQVRSEQHRQIIHQEFRDARATFERYEVDLPKDDAAYVQSLY